MRESLKIIGVDPGSIRTGWGVIELSGSSIRYVDSGVISFGSKRFVSQKLVVLYSELQKILKKYSPKEASIEDIFYHKNARSSLVLGYVRGVCLLCLKNEGCLNVYQYSPKKVKLSVTGAGSGTKEKVKIMISKILKIDKKMKYEDESDALASAICHANNRNFSNFGSLI